MVKSRFDASDVRAMVRDLRGRLLGMRAANIYDVNAKTYLLKLAEPGREKEVLVIESGTRFHTTKFDLDKNMMPSGFAMKLRKHLRAKRLEDLRQLGTDRVVIFTFGVGESTNRLILELYAQGNIILTDKDYRILALLRVHDYGDGASARVGCLYPLAEATTATAAHGASPSGCPQGPAAAASSQGSILRGASIRTALTTSGGASPAGGAGDQGARIHISTSTTAAELREWAAARLEEMEAERARKEREREESAAQRPQKKKKRGGGGGKGTMSLKSLLLSKGCSVSVFGGAIVEHALLRAGVKPGLKVPLEAGALRDRDRCPFLSPASAAPAFDAVAEDSAEGTLGRALYELAQCASLFASLDRPGLPGFIVVKRDAPRPNAAAGEGGEEGEGGAEEDLVAFTDFLPALLLQHESLETRRFESFDAAVDAYFGAIESQRLLQAARQAERSAMKRLDAIRGDQQRRVDALLRDEERLEQSARAVEAASEVVDEALRVVGAAAETNLEWEDLEELIREDAQQGHPIATLIEGLNLDSGSMTMSLPLQAQDARAAGAAGGDAGSGEGSDTDGAGDEDEEEDAEEEDAQHFDDEMLLFFEEDGASAQEAWWMPTRAELAAAEAKSSADRRAQRRLPSRRVLVELMLFDSAFGNARRLWGMRKAAAEKVKKTATATAAAIEKAERSSREQLSASSAKRRLETSRKKMWFEKFVWFATSENYLAILGRDAQQNEMLVRRYLRAGDAYIHADVHGASSCILRNKDPSGQRPLSPLALQEAGHLCVCRSSAWAAKTGGVSAWWVDKSQVSKTAPSGEYLPTGSFMVRGKKHYLPAVQLELGVGALFQLHEDSVKNHENERYDRFTPEQSARAHESEGRALPQPAAAREDKAAPSDDAGAAAEDFAAAAAAAAAAPADAAAQEAGGEALSDERRRELEGELASLAAPSFLRAGRITPRERKALKRRSGVTLEVIREEEAQRRCEARRLEIEGLLRGAAPGGEGDAEALEGDSAASASDAAPPEASPAKGGGGGVRGRKGKLRKMKRKYKNQDAEDRRFAELVNHGGNAALLEAMGGAGGGAGAEDAAGEESERRQRDAWAQLGDESSQLLAGLSGAARQEIEAAARDAEVVLSGPDADVSPAELPQLLSLEAASAAAVLKAFRIVADRLAPKADAKFRGRAMRGKASRVLAELIRKAATLEDRAGEGELAERLAAGVGPAPGAAGPAGGPESRRALARREAEEIAALLESEGVAQGSQGDGSDGDVLARLTAVPLPQDLLLCAVPVVAPYATMAKYRYKAKLVPGRGKKGRIGRQALEMFASQAQLEEQRCGRMLKAMLRNPEDEAGARGKTPEGVKGEMEALGRERALLKAIDDNDFVQQMVGDVSLSMAGAQGKKAKGGSKKGGKRK